MATQRRSGCAGTWLDPIRGGVAQPPGYSVLSGNRVHRVPSTEAFPDQCGDLRGQRLCRRCGDVFLLGAGYDDRQLAPEAFCSPAFELAESPSPYLLIGLGELP